MKLALRQWQMALVVATLALLASLLALFWLDRGSVGAQSPWFYNAAGYQQASYKAQRNVTPLLIWMVNRDCLLCSQREKEWWPNSAERPSLNGWQMVRLEREADPATAELVESFLEPGDKLPLLILEASPQEERQRVELDAGLQHFRVTDAEATSAWQPLNRETLQQLLLEYREAQLASQSP